MRVQSKLVAISLAVLVTLSSTALTASANGPGNSNSNAGGNSASAGNSSNAANPGNSSNNSGGNSSNAGGNSSNTVPITPVSASSPAPAANPGNSSNNAGGNSSNAGGNSANNTPAVTGPAPEIAAAPSVAAAEARADKADDDARGKAEAAAAAAKQEADAKREAEAAAAAKRDADAALRNAERAASSANAAAAKAAADRLEEARARAARAAAEASATAAEAASSSKDAKDAKAAANAAAVTAKSLNKVKGAAEECISFVETRSASDAAECALARYVVRFNNGVDPELQAKGMSAIKIPVRAVLNGVFSGAVADLNAGQLRALLASGRIRSVEQDYEIKLAATQDNPTWGLDRVDQVSLPLSASYANTQQGLGVKAYIVDTGVFGTHAEFSGRMAAGFSAISDGLGTVDCNGHGTHVAGTVAGTIYGVAKQAQVIPVRVLDCAGSGFLSGVVAGLDWIGQNHAVGTPGVVNMSLGGGISSTLDAAVEGLVSKGIPVVVAAGNSSADACNSSPARTPGAMTVAASNISDGFAFFSNFGSCVDVIAPGVEVLSAWYTSTTATASLQGTSMAAPHVAGLVASLLTAGYKTPGQISFEIESKSALGKITSLPAGTPNRLVQVIAPAPVVVPAPVTESPVVQQPISESPVVQPPTPAVTAPIAPVLTSADGQKTAARINWQISPNGGAPLTGHIVRVWERGQLARAVNASATATSIRITGLKVGVSYTFTVLAVNSVGQSADSNVSTAYTPRR